MRKRNKYFFFIVFLLTSIGGNIFTSCSKFEENTLFLTDPYKLIFKDDWYLYSFKVNGIEKVPGGTYYHASFLYDYHGYSPQKRKFNNAGKAMGYRLSYELYEKVPGISEYGWLSSIRDWTITKLNSKYLNLRRNKGSNDTIEIIAKFIRGK